MLWELLVFGSFWFWLFCAAALFAIAYKAIKEEGGEATGFLIIFIGVFCVIGDRSIMRWFVAHPWWVVFICASYVAAGGIVSWFKWHRYSSVHREKYDKLKLEFLRDKKVNPDRHAPIPKRLIAEWQDQLRRSYNISRTDYSDSKINYITMKTVIPQILDHKKLVTGWMAYWPIHFIWALTHDIFVRIWEEVYNLFRNFYQRTANRAFKGIEDDIVLESDRDKIES